MRWLRRLFGRDEPERPAIHDRRQPNDWKPGDLAVCVADCWHGPNFAHPVRNEINIVAEVRDGLGTYQPIRAHFLVFAKYGAGYDATRFRKIRPAHEPAEAEFSEFIKRPVRAPEKVRAG